MALKQEAKKPDEKREDRMAPRPVPAKIISDFVKQKQKGPTERELLDKISKTYGDTKVQIRLEIDPKTRQIKYLDAKTVADVIELFNNGKYPNAKSKFIEELWRFERLNKREIPLGDDFERLGDEQKGSYAKNVSFCLRRAFKQALMF